MSLIVELEKLEYEKFVKNNKYKSHFLQSYTWGEFSKKKKRLTPYYIGLKDKNKIVAATLLLEKRLPLGYSYFYAPRGFVIDFSNKNLLKEMSTKIIEFIKKKNKKALFLKIDPDIIIKSYNYLGEENKLPYNYQDIFDNIKACGFKHLGFTKNFETMQPRYTFRIDMEKSLDEIENCFSKTTKQRINKAKKLGCEVSIGDINDIDEFYHLMMLTENRKDFVSYSKDYYEEQYNMLEKEDMAVLFLGKVNTKRVIDNLNIELTDINNSINDIDPNNTGKNAKNKLKSLNNQKEKILNEIEKYKKYQKKYGQVITLNAHMIIKYGDKAWVLYAGNHNILTESYANYLTYFEHIKYCKENNIKIYDQFGTIGDLSKDNPRLGLHEFKKKFGGDYVEFIGEFDYVIKPVMYFVFTKLVPLYRKLVRKKSKMEVNNEAKRDK